MNTASSHAWKWNWLELDLTLWVRASVAAEFHRYRQAFWQKERGGQLFVSTDSQVGLELTLATPPHSRDRSGYTWLDLDHARCRAEIELANAKGLRLVGYWHTHPQHTPELSSQDLLSFQKFIDANAESLPSLLAVVVGRSRSRSGIRAWSIRSDSIQPATCVGIETATAD